jgi:hypothetical protein
MKTAKTARLMFPAAVEGPKLFGSSRLLCPEKSQA